MTMPRTITIGCSRGSQDMYSVLQRAVQLLRAASVRVDAAAQNVHVDSPPTATILLRDLNDKARAALILDSAGILVHKGQDVRP